jgi:hypothetical protein
MATATEDVDGGHIPMTDDPVVFTGGTPTGGDDSGTLPPTAF